jgi:hypothetical protein
MNTREFTCTGLELKILSAALFMGLNGTQWMAARALAKKHESELERVREHVDRVRDAAWSNLAGPRKEVVQRRKAVEVTVQLPAGLCDILAAIVLACVDDADTASELSPFTGVMEYGVSPDDFRSLSSRLRAASSNSSSG